MRKKLKWTLLTIAGLYIIIGFFILPWIIKSQLPRIVDEATKGYLELEAVSFNPLIARLDLVGIHFLDPNQERFVDLGRLTINVNPLALVLGRLEVDNVTLDKPRISVLHQADGSFNFDWLTKLEAAEEENALKKSQSNGDLPHIVLKKIAINDGRVLYRDLTKADEFDVQLGPVDLEVRDIDTAKLENSKDKINFFTGINDGGSLVIKTDIVSLEPLAIKGHMTYDSGALYTQWRYLKDQFELEVADGKVTATLDFNVDLADLEAMRIDNIHVALNKLRIKPKSQYGDVLRVGLIVLDGGVVEPLKQRIALEDFQIRDVAVFAKREADGSIDWKRFAKVSGGTSESAEKSVEPQSNEIEGQPWHVTLKHFGMDSIKATFVDEAVTPNVTTQLDNLKLDIHEITSQPASSIDYNLSLLLNTIMHCQGGGKAEHTPLNVTTSFGCQEIDLTWFRPYIDQAARGALKHYDIALEEGAVGFDLHLQAAENNGTVGINVYNTSLLLDALKIKQSSTKAMLVDLKQMRIDGVSADTLAQQVSVQNFLLDRPLINVERTKEGAINLSEVAVPKSIDTAKGDQKVPSEKSENPWVVNLDQFVIDTGKVTFRDRAVKGGASFTVDKIDVKVDDISTQSKSTLKYRTTMRINNSGKFSADGRLQHTPLKQSGSIALQGFRLKELNPYLEEKSYIHFKDGRFSYQAKESYAVSKTKPDLKTKGKITISKLAMHDTRDDTRLLALKKLTINPLVFEYAPDNLFIDEVLIDGFYANAVVDTDRSLNFAALQKAPEEEAKSQEKRDVNVTAKPFPMKIVKVKIESSSAHFADYSLPLDFLTYIQELDGVVYNISSQSVETSYIDLDGVVDKYGSAKIKGSVNTADPKAFTDMTVSFRNLSLNNYSPYSAKFAGRKIDDGKLFIDLGYKINDSEMYGENSIILKKIKLGDDIESEDAISLPLGLAIALLEDSDGVIDIDMPVEGNVDQPDFKYGTVVWNAFSNLITNIATAPFRFLGSLLGMDGDELENIAFEPGKSDIGPSEREKLDMLAKAFKKRPLLQLGVTGTYDEQSDKTALQREKVIAAALERMKGDKATREASELTQDILEELYVSFSSKEQLRKMEKTVKKAYREAKDFEKAYREKLHSDLIGMQRVSVQELQSLASKRAETVASYLAVAQGTDSKRIDMKESGISEEKAAEWVNTKLSIEVNEKE